MLRTSGGWSAEDAGQQVNFRFPFGVDANALYCPACPPDNFLDGLAADPPRMGGRSERPFGSSGLTEEMMRAEAVG
jgi:hypothetical protein